MDGYNGLYFIGIIESMGDTPAYNYCSLNTQSGGMTAFATVEDLGRVMANRFGSNFGEQITYEPPQSIDTSGRRRNLCDVRYHSLSVIERDKFERSVLNALLGKE